MLYSKKIDQVTYEDIESFCEEQITENIGLDYKEAIEGGLVKTIAAMANTWGGIVIIGAEDEDSKPKLPLKGIENKEHLREQINNLILGNITPPVFPEIQIVPSPDGQRCLVLIRVPQSNTTPHAVKGNTKVYLRTETSNEPEELATVDRILWLVDRRARSTALKDSFFERSRARLRGLVGKETPISKGEMILTASPLYPYETMIDYRKLRDGIPDEIKTEGYHQTFPLNVGYQRFEPTQNGSYSLMYNTQTGYLVYEELNHYGYFYHSSDVVHSETDEAGKETHRIYLIHLLVWLDLFMQSMGKLYSALGYWGYVDLKMRLNNVGDVVFEDLPAVRGSMKWSETKTPIDNQIVIAREVMVRDLIENRAEIVAQMFAEFAWAVGFPQIGEAQIKEMFEKGW